MHILCITRGKYCLAHICVDLVCPSNLNSSPFDFFFFQHEDPCQVEFCVVKTFPSDVASESSCFQLLTTSTTDTSSKSSSMHRPLPSSSHSSHSRTNFLHHQFSGHMTIGCHGNKSLAFPEFANPIHSHREDGLEEGRCVLAIGEVVKVNIHPQEKANNSFNVFS